jgi:sn-glycerol 3-phosphate transport system substrate-binding protein
MKGKSMNRRSFLKSGFVSAIALGGVSGLTSAPWASKKVTLRYWTFLDPKDPGPRSVAQTQIIEAFHKKYPEIEVKPEVMAWQQIDPQLVQAAGAGKGPDVTRIAGESVAVNTLAGTIIPLNPWTDKWTKAQKADFHGDWDASLIQGNKMTLPIGVAVTIFTYRKDLFEKAGLKVPTTWEELTVAAKALTKDPVWGTGVGLSQKNRASNVYQTLFPQVWSYGGDVLQGKRAVLDHPAWVETFRYWRDMVKVHKAAPQGMVNETTDTIMEGFRAGTFATMFQHNHKLAQVKTSKVIPPDSMGVTFMPGKGGKPGPNPMAGWSLAMSKDVKEKEAAWLFIEHTTGAEMQLINAKVAEEVPSRKSVGADPWFKTDEARYIQAYLKVAAESSKVFPYPAEFASLCDKLAVAIQQVIVNNAPIEKMLKEAQDKYNAEVA